MPERQYFSLRYAIPGYTFLLLVIGINHVPLLQFLESKGLGSVFGAFLAFLYLFSGSAIGFLVSQFWYLWFKSHPFLGNKELEPVAQEIFEKYLKFSQEITNETTSQEIREHIEAIGDIFEYIIRFEKQEKFFVLAERRWDMYHILSSTFWSLGIGVAIGLICRLYCEFTLFGASFCLANGKAEFGSLVLIFIGVAVLLGVFWEGRKKLLDTYCPIMKSLIIRSRVTIGELRNVFPDYFGNDKQS